MPWDVLNAISDDSPEWSWFKPAGIDISGRASPPTADVGSVASLGTSQRGDIPAQHEAGTSQPEAGTSSGSRAGHGGNMDVFDDDGVTNQNMDVDEIQVSHSRPRILRLLGPRGGSPEERDRPPSPDPSEGSPEERDRPPSPDPSEGSPEERDRPPSPDPSEGSPEERDRPPSPDPSEDMDVDDDTKGYHLRPRRVTTLPPSDKSLGKRKKAPPIRVKPKKSKTNEVNRQAPSTALKLVGSWDAPIDVDKLFVSLISPLSICLPLIMNPGRTLVYA
jgi:hypothetical protein